MNADIRGLPKILLVHHGRHHFEVVLALLANLRDSYEVSLWSNGLSFFGRQQLLPELHVALFDPETNYDALVIVSGETLPTESEAGQRLSELLHTKPVLRMLHSRTVPEAWGDIRLFPKTRSPVTPVRTGLDFLQGYPDSGRRSLLVQGNVENRRNYALLPSLVTQFPQLDWNVIGIRVQLDLASGPNLQLRFNQSERDFHSTCANSTFILPLIDPDQYGQYFKDRFTSSIQIGFAYRLPFIAHSALFDLYPIVGYRYKTNAELPSCIEAAAKCTEEELQRLRSQMAENGLKIFRSNIENFREHLRQIAPN